jgi:hypothetical protein
MTDLPFVNWDRGTEWIYEGRRCMTVYGWIEREKDDYKDFVLVGVYEEEDSEEASVEFHGTSSKKYSKEIQRRLFPDEDIEEMHNECFRLEDKFDVPNLIRLKDGGENR